MDDFYVDTGALAVFEKANAFIGDSHFVYKAQTHGEIYANKDAVYPHPELLGELAMIMADRIEDLIEDGSI